MRAIAFRGPVDVHTYRNNSGKLARYLVQTVPSGFEKMVAECGKPVPAGTSPAAPREEDIQRLLSVAPKYGIEILAPPGT